MTGRSPGKALANPHSSASGSERQYVQSVLGYVKSF